MAKRRKTFSPEFRLEAAGLVIDQGYTVKAACDAMGVSKSSMENWVRQLRQERRGQTPRATAMTKAVLESLILKHNAKRAFADQIRDVK